MANLTPAPAAYNQRDQQEFRNEMNRRDDKYHKNDRHVEVGKDRGVIWTDTVTGTRYRVTVASGAFVLTAL